MRIFVDLCSWILPISRQAAALRQRDATPPARRTAHTAAAPHAAASRAVDMSALRAFQSSLDRSRLKTPRSTTRVPTCRSATSDTVPARSRASITHPRPQYAAFASAHSHVRDGPRIVITTVLAETASLPTTPCWRHRPRHAICAIALRTMLVPDELV